MSSTVWAQLIRLLLRRMAPYWKRCSLAHWLSRPINAGALLEVMLEQQSRYPLREMYLSPAFVLVGLTVLGLDTSTSGISKGKEIILPCTV